MTANHEHSIVVGYDGSEGAQVALDWAAREARLRGEKLCVVQAWSPGEFGQDEEMEAYADQPLKQQMTDMLKDEDVDWESTTVKGHPGKVLIEHSAGADMLVVGSRGRGGFK